MQPYAMLCGSLSSLHGASWDRGLRRPASVEVSCKYIE